MLIWCELFGICIAVLYVLEIVRRDATQDLGRPTVPVPLPSPGAGREVNDFLRGYVWGRFHALSGRGPLFNSFRSSAAELAGYVKGFYNPRAPWWS